MNQHESTKQWGKDIYGGETLSFGSCYRLWQTTQHEICTSRGRIILVVLDILPIVADSASSDI